MVIACIDPPILIKKVLRLVFIRREKAVKQA